MGNANCILGNSLQFVRGADSMVAYRYRNNFYKFWKILMSGSILIIILSRYIDRENYCHVTNKQTNALVSIKTPTMWMSRRYTFFIKKKKKITVLWYTIDSHNNFFIGMDRTIQEINNKITILFYDCLATHVILDLYRWRGHHRPRV